MVERGCRRPIYSQTLQPGVVGTILRKEVCSDSLRSHKRVTMYSPASASIPSEDRISTYIDFFNDLSKPESIFRAFQAAVPEKTADHAKVIGSLWYHLSEAIVDILCVALAKLKKPRIRHLVAQTVYEELGESSIDSIHTNLLRDMLLLARVDDTDILRWSGHEGINREIDALKGDLEACETDAEICGLLLGMELIAYQNVDTVIDYLSFNEAVGVAVRETPWARLHHQLEEGHIRRAVSVFVDDVPELTSQRHFVRTFMRTMRFWSEFWGQIAAATHAGRTVAAGE